MLAVCIVDVAELDEAPSLARHDARTRAGDERVVLSDMAGIRRATQRESKLGGPARPFRTSVGPIGLRGFGLRIAPAPEETPW